MSGPFDTSTSELKRLLEWGVEDFHCTKERVTALIQAVIAAREECIATEQRYTKILSDMEIKRAKTNQTTAKPKLQDGIRYASPEQRPLGPDGFPQRGIV